jgi:peptidoglycan/xylan/chitin deacetylase (PgdA/CDA1 family)
MKATGFFRTRWRVVTAVLLGVAALATIFWYVTESPKNQMWGQTVTSAHTKQKVVALTYDDGPNPPYTQEIVDYLHSQHVVATFFVVGVAVVAHPEVVRLEVRDGDAIGNHTWDHAHIVFMRRKHIEREILSTQDAIQRVVGIRTTMFRPPFGARDFAVINTAHRLGYAVIMWSVPLPGDWRQPPPQVIADRVLKYVRDGGIVVLHDGNRGKPADRRNTVEATKLIVVALKKQGYRFVTVPQLMAMGYAEATPAPGPTEYGPFFTPRL